MPENQPSPAHPTPIMKWMFKFYVFLATFTGLLGVTFFAWYFLSDYILPHNIKVDLGSGFVYQSHSLLNEDGQLLVDGGIASLRIYDNIACGYRDKSYAPYEYFICDAGRDCTDTQNYDYETFKQRMAEKGFSVYVGGQDHRSLITTGALQKIGIF